MPINFFITRSVKGQRPYYYKGYHYWANTQEEAFSYPTEETAIQDAYVLKLPCKTDTAGRCPTGKATVIGVTKQDNGKMSTVALFFGELNKSLQS